MPKMTFSHRAMRLLKHVVSFTGETEVNMKGQEIPSPRRLNGKESAQRRHFSKAIKPLEEAQKESLDEMTKAHNEKVKEKRKEFEKTNPKEEKEETKDYKIRIDGMINQDEETLESSKSLLEKIKEMSNEKAEIEVTDQTFAVLKKYYLEFGKEAGFVDGDDESVEELETILG